LRLEVINYFFKLNSILNLLFMGVRVRDQNDYRF